MTSLRKRRQGNGLHGVRYKAVVRGVICRPVSPPKKAKDWHGIYRNTRVSVCWVPIVGVAILGCP